MRPQNVFDLLIQSIFDQKILRNQPPNLGSECLCGAIQSEQFLVKQARRHRLSHIINQFLP
jgi:hypothetical protein